MNISEISVSDEFQYLRARLIREQLPRQVDRARAIQRHDRRSRQESRDVFK